MTGGQAENNIVLFYHEYERYGCFSNWYHAEFKYAGKNYFSAEQYMMAQKVMIFHQYDLAKEILNETDPSVIKKLGRTRFRGFDADVWEHTCYAIVKRGIRAKFQQNPDLLACLLSTGGKLLAEAAPNDGKWGIGVSADDDRSLDIQHWTGKNFLGRILMEVRDELGRNPDFRYEDAMDRSFSEWYRKPGELWLIPRYHETVSAYVETLRVVGLDAKSVLYCGTFADWEDCMRNNMGGGLPVSGFWEMKQDIYDLSRLA